MVKLFGTNRRVQGHRVPGVRSKAHQILACETFTNICSSSQKVITRCHVRRRSVRTVESTLSKNSNSSITQNRFGDLQQNVQGVSIILHHSQSSFLVDASSCTRLQAMLFLTRLMVQGQRVLLPNRPVEHTSASIYQQSIVRLQKNASSKLLHSNCLKQNPSLDECNRRSDFQ